MRIARPFSFWDPRKPNQDMRTNTPQGLHNKNPRTYVDLGDVPKSSVHKGLQFIRSWTSNFHLSEGLYLMHVLCAQSVSLSTRCCRSLEGPGYVLISTAFVQGNALSLSFSDGDVPRWFVPPAHPPSLLIAGVVVFMLGEEASFMTSLYWVIVTSSSIGYGDVVPTSPAMRWFTTFYSIAATGAMLETLRFAGTFPFTIWTLRAEAKVDYDRPLRLGA